ncbi:hypothetical protein LCGC14_1834180 [marine sediment metagenome]|uniref:Uncharacterized protein n=1 Tax=marine sediment metagenome TaxID=412755 RepID=A0A0F9IUP2_9ZZZZ
MAHLQYSIKDKGFYVSTRRDLNLGWVFLNDNGEPINQAQGQDLTSYEQMLVNWRSLNPKKRKRRRLNLKQGGKKND